jgi:hypothetical protein
LESGTGTYEVNRHPDIRREILQWQRYCWIGRLAVGTAKLYLELPQRHEVDMIVVSSAIWRDVEK